MPTNLPPEYYPAEERYREAVTPDEKISALEEMLSLIPKHKGTDHLRADLRRKLSRLKEAADLRKGGARVVSPYQIDREGAGQVVVIGPANSGKSSLVDALTNAAPEVAPYPYTTRMPMPGMMAFENVQIQLIDTPPLDPEDPDRQLLDLVRRADLILLVLDVQAFPIEAYEETLEVLAAHRIFPTDQAERAAEHRVSWIKPLLAVVNKTDSEAQDADFEVLCELLGEPVCPLVPISVTNDRGLDAFKQAVYDKLDIIRVYSSPPGKEPNFDAPFVLKRGDTVEDFAAKVHKDFVKSLKSARVWGEGVFDGQQVGPEHTVSDRDVVELHV